MGRRPATRMVAALVLAVVLAGACGDSFGPDGGAAAPAEQPIAPAEQRIAPAASIPAGTTPATTEGAVPGRTGPGGAAVPVAPAEAEYALGLAGDGLLLIRRTNGSTLRLAFGMPRDVVERALTAQLGPPDRPDATCATTGDALLRWPATIELEFRQGLFRAWRLPAGSTLTDLTGIGLGAPAALAVDGAVVVTTVPAGADGSVEFATDESTSDEGTADGAQGRGGLHGLLSGAGPDAIVVALWAGPSCRAT